MDEVVGVRRLEVLDKLVVAVVIDVLPQLVLGVEGLALEFDSDVLEEGDQLGKITPEVFECFLERLVQSKTRFWFVGSYKRAAPRAPTALER